jgi:lipopolysaccharide/colanic/teichoic acid biosynthesis glycosyltransferase
MTGSRSRYSPGHRLFDLLLTMAGFGAALLLYNALFVGGLAPHEVFVSCGSSVIAFWLAIQLKDWGGDSTRGRWVIAVEQFCFGTGVNLLLHALMTYGLLARRTPFLIVTGSLFSTVLLAAARHMVFARQNLESRVLMLGCDTVAQAVFRSLRVPVLGVVGASGESTPEGIPSLGGIENLDAVIEAFRPTHLLVGLPDWRKWVDPALLLRYRRQGIVVEEAKAVYEKLFDRVCCERLQPLDLLSSSALRGDSRTMAIQAIYTNLVALFLLLLSSPLIFLISLAVGLFSGPGPVFESVECAGFQYIPFRLLRFRTERRDGIPTSTRVGRAIKWARLANLPQLVNIVRGDMALVGPTPVRREFAAYLTELMPFYSHRFSVKPGIVSWARTNAPRHTLADDCSQVEYDLYYIKEGSLWLDIEILLQAVPFRKIAFPTAGKGPNAPPESIQNAA